MPYNEKIIKMAQEPVAFQLYKKRDFYILDPRSIGQKQLNLKKDFKNELLAVANAKLISRFRFLKMLEEHCEKGMPLKNRIINLPPDEERSMRDRLEKAIKEAKGTENDFRKKRPTGGMNSRLTGGSNPHTKSGEQASEASPTLRASNMSGEIGSIHEVMAGCQFDNPSDRIIYSKGAFEGNQIFIYEEDQYRIHAEDLLEIIMKLIDEDIEKQKHENFRILKAKKRQMILKREAQQRAKEREKQHYLSFQNSQSFKHDTLNSDEDDQFGSNEDVDLVANDYNET